MLMNLQIPAGITFNDKVKPNSILKVWNYIQIIIKSDFIVWPAIKNNTVKKCLLFIVMFSFFYYVCNMALSLSLKYLMVLFD